MQADLQHLRGPIEEFNGENGSRLRGLRIGLQFSLVCKKRRLKTASSGSLKNLFQAIITQIRYFTSLQGYCVFAWTKFVRQILPPSTASVSHFG